MADEQENPLDAALRLAANEPAQRPDFYQALLKSSVFILSESEGSSDGVRNLAAGEKISIQNWLKDDGSPVIPFFTSLAALQRAIQQEATFMELPARSLFEMTRGTSLFLNPKSHYGKEFLPNEIEALLSTGVNQLPEQRGIQQSTEVLLGQPANYPAKMVDSLTTLFSKRSTVKAAYLALMHDQSLDARPHLLIGIDAEGDIEPIIREAGVVAFDAAPKGEPVDLIRIEPGEQGLSAYFVRDVKPFYERRWGGKLRSFLGL